MTFTELDLIRAEAMRELRAVAESDIRGAHGESDERPALSGIAPEVYDELIRQEEAYREELEAQRRASGDEQAGLQDS